MHGWREHTRISKKDYAMWTRDSASCRPDRTCALLRFWRRARPAEGLQDESGFLPQSSQPLRGFIPIKPIII